MKEQPNYYAILSAEVRYDDRLKANVKLLYAEITALCNMNAECFASNKYFADLYKKEKGTISGWVSQLVKYGYVEVRYTYKEGTRQISHRYVKIINKGMLKISKTLCDKNLKSNTTRTNTMSINTKGSFKKPTIIEIGIVVALLLVGMFDLIRLNMQPDITVDLNLAGQLFENTAILLLFSWLKKKGTS